jgi:hypothetical protein
MMTVFVVETYVIKPEKQAELAAYKSKWRKFFGYKDGRLLSFKEVKSHRMFSQMLGGNTDGFVEMFEFESLADVEKFSDKLMKSDYVTKLYPVFISLIVPGSRSMSVWASYTYT